MSMELLQRARQGDVEAFAELFEAARPVVYAVACRLVGPTDAEDVVMDTYLKAWKALPAFSGRSILRTWLCRIAHHGAVDRLRARRREVDPSLPAGEDGLDRTLLDTLPDPRQRPPWELADAADTGARIQQALESLSEEHRTTLMLRFSDGLSYAEIAAATGVSIGTVMSRLFNGRRRLMKRLKATKGESP